ncbi:MAG: hypothetical protein OFPI_15710 [Osedax symbiont Rs2]|nr:MAG: hypothetical protein OFPI_15710 [Osedax symbiont Rs2]
MVWDIDNFFSRGHLAKEFNYGTFCTYIGTRSQVHPVLFAHNSAIDTTLIKA